MGQLMTVPEEKGVSVGKCVVGYDNTDSGLYLTCTDCGENDVNLGYYATVDEIVEAERKHLETHG